MERSLPSISEADSIGYISKISALCYCRQTQAWSDAASLRSLRRSSRVERPARSKVFIVVSKAAALIEVTYFDRCWPI
jgi:hypothetical protein